MYILGIHGGVRISQHNPSATLIRDNQILTVIEEERLNCVKISQGHLPERAIKHCLDSNGLKIQDIDLIVSTGETYQEWKDVLRSFIEFKFGFCPPIELVHHHVAHAYSAFAVSGFEECMVLTADAVGDKVSTLLGHAKDGKLEILKTFPGTNSLGYFYNVVTQLVGFKQPEDAYKVMGLASYGKPIVDMDPLLKIKPDGEFELSPAAFRSFPVAQSSEEKQYAEEIEKIYGKARNCYEKVSEFHENFAASAQKRLEEVVCELVRWLHQKTGLRKVALAGGVALNCVANQRVFELDCIDDVFIQPASDDGGLSLGAALKAACDRGFRFERLETVCYGSQYSNEQIEEILKQCKVPYERVSNVAKAAAKDLALNKILGWFQGRMEFGPRALGGRSILGDARDPDMKDKINILVKYREEFRPFAPAITEDAAAEYFVNCKSAPFMTLTFDVVESKKEVIPAVTHVDGTARVQTVNRKQNARYYDLLKEFEKITGVPVLINTSFNIKGQPIVENPYQALATFFATGMDSLYIGDFVVRKG